MNHVTALLATSRIANVPSVVSNVFLGALVLAQTSEPTIAHTLVTAATAACLLYIAGNFLNDWHDVEWDQKHRPERAIPSGLFHRRTYLLAASVLFVLSISLGFFVNLLVAILLCITAGLVILYTFIHKKSLDGIWVMGSCRAMLFFVGIAAVDPDYSFIAQLISPHISISALHNICVLFFFPPVGMACYIAGISLLAKAEALQAQQIDCSLALPRFLVFMPILSHGAIISIMTSQPILICHLLFHALCVFGVWTGFATLTKIPIGKRVARLLMGIPLIDAIWLSTFLSLNLFLGKVANEPETWLFATPLIAFLLAWLLQKIAPPS